MNFFKDEDQHLHFSGSLPLNFLWQCYEETREDRDVRACIAKHFSGCRTELHNVSELRQLIDSSWSTDWRANLVSFFSIYATVQQITRSARVANGERFYYQATREIVCSQLGNGVQGGEIICGPSLNNAETRDRLVGMCSALQEINGHRFGLRLTFIRGSDGRFKNLSARVLDHLRTVLRDPVILGFVRGFDFSGQEHPHLIDDTYDAICAVDRLRSTLDFPDWDISVHIGEDLRVDAELHLSGIEKLLLSPITRISHGTFLWIPSRLIKISDSQKQTRERLLRRLAEKGGVLEICPSANMKMSPIAFASELPFQLLDELGLKWSIISDNPTIFNTTMYREFESAFSPD